MLTGSNNVHAISQRGWIKRALRVEWLGQTMASLFWIISVLTYGITVTGDWLQLLAASAWLIANIAALVTSSPTETLNSDTAASHEP